MYEVSDISTHPLGATLIILERDECLQNRSWYHFVAPAWFAHDPVAQRYEQRFGQLDWQAFPASVDTLCPGRLPHPRRAYVQTFCVMIEEGMVHVTQVWRYLCEHPALVWLLGFRLQPDSNSPYGFALVHSLPTPRHLRRMFASLPHGALRQLLAQSVQQAVEHIPAFGQVVSLDVQHIYAHVAHNNPHQFVNQRFDPQHQPSGDQDCRLGWKAYANQRPGNEERGEWLWGYGSGIAVSQTPSRDALVLAEWTQTFNCPDVTYGQALLAQAQDHLGFVPPDVTADAAFDAYHMYQGRPEGGLAAIPLNSRGQELTCWNVLDQPLCNACQVALLPRGKKSWLEKGRHVRRFRCPRCQRIRKLVVEPGARLRVQLDRQSPRYKSLYKQRTACERVNSQAEALHIQHPHQRRLAFIARRNTLIYLLINLRALRRFHERTREPPLSPPSSLFVRPSVYREGEQY